MKYKIKCYTNTVDCYYFRFVLMLHIVMLCNHLTHLNQTPFSCIFEILSIILNDNNEEKSFCVYQTVKASFCSLFFKRVASFFSSSLSLYAYRPRASSSELLVLWLMWILYFCKQFLIIFITFCNKAKHCNAMGYLNPPLLKPIYSLCLNFAQTFILSVIIYCFNISFLDIRGKVEFTADILWQRYQF